MERVDDLQVNGLRLIQDDNYFCFGCDSVELANFVTGSPRDFAIDLGAGSGIISVLLAGKKNIKVTAVEIQSELSALCQRNVSLNGLNGMIDVLNMPLQRLRDVLPKASRTIVVTNPPYFKAGSGLKREGPAGTARHEIAVSQTEIVECADYILGTGGRFYIVYPAARLAELMSTCRQHRLEPKELVLLYAGTKKPHLFLLKCVKDGNVGLKVECRQIKEYGME